MPKITDTYALAYACCDTILKELQRFPTIDLIRERIGVNSPNTIKKAMNDWTIAFAKHYIEQRATQTICPEVPSVLTDAVYQLWQITSAAAQERIDAQAVIFHQQTEAWQQTLTHQQQQLQQAEQLYKQLQQQLQTLSEQLAVSQQDNNALQTTLTTQHQAYQILEQTLIAQQQQRELELKAQHEQRLQQEQAWMQRRIVEEKSLIAEQWQEKQQRLDERLTFLKQQLEQLTEAYNAIQAHNRQLLLEVTQLKTKSANELPPHRFKLPRRIR